MNNSYWNGYTRSYTSSTLQDWVATTPTNYGSTYEYIRLEWTGRATDVGGFFVSKETINASNINYLGVSIYPIDDSGTGSYAHRYDFYVSVASSASNPVNSDSGVGVYDYITGGGITTYFLIDLTKCTRTGYLKIGMICIRRSSTTGSYGAFDLNDVVTGSTTTRSDYPLSTGTSINTSGSWTDTITVT